MAAHSVTAYDAALAGAAAALTFGRRQIAVGGTAYDELMAVADAIAQQVDTEGQLGALGAGKEAPVLAMLTFSQFAGRYPHSVTLLDYAVDAAAIIAAYTEIAAKLQ